MFKFHRGSREEAQPASVNPERPTYMTPGFWVVVREILSNDSTSDNEDQEVSQTSLAPQEGSSVVAPDVERHEQDFEIDLSFKGIARAVAEARRDGEPYGYAPTVY